MLTGYRIGDPKGAHPIFDATGSKLYPGRWNTPVNPVIYASAHYSTAMLEKLAHGSGVLPPNQHWIDTTIPNGITYETFGVAHMPMWAAPACMDAKGIRRRLADKQAAVTSDPGLSHLTEDRSGELVGPSGALAFAPD
nr:RES domain-containing protein [Acidisphaera sp. S103]